MSSLAVLHKSIIATKISEANRVRVLATHFPRAYVRFENIVLHIAERIGGQVQSDPWEFFELSNGGFYMAPATPTQYAVDIPFGRRYCGHVSHDAFGIICCLYACCFLAEQDDRMALHYVWLTDFYQVHVESADIWWAID